MKQSIVTLDLEGVLVPEIWIAFAEKTGIEKLRLTTRDISDYDQLMKGRLQILREHGLTLTDIQAVIDTVNPLPGAVEFLNWVRTQTQLVILTDSYYEFIAPFRAKLGYPTFFCNSLETDGENRIVNYHLRIRDGKKAAVLAFKSIGFRVIAGGDSYNDTTMLAQADVGLLFRPPDNVMAEFPQFKVFHEYDALRDHLAELLSESC